jgi:hypothetical protein
MESCCSQYYLLFAGYIVTVGNDGAGNGDKIIELKVCQKTEGNTLLRAALHGCSQQS